MNANGAVDVRHIEKSLLGGLLRWPSMAGDVSFLVTEEDFTDFANGKVFAALLSLWHDGAPVDIGSVADRLREKNLIHDVPYSYLAQLIDGETTGAGAVHNARILQERSIARRLALACQECGERAAAFAEPLDELIDGCERKILEIGENRRADATVHCSVAIREMRDIIDARRDRFGEITVATGFLDLDAVLSGLHNSELCIVAARPGTGKTAFGIAIALQALSDGAGVFFASLEQSRPEIMERACVSSARVSSHHLRSGHPSQEDLVKLSEAATHLERMPFFINDASRQSALDISASARRLWKRGEIRVVIVDYLQFVDPENRKDPRHEQVAQVSRRLKKLARELKMPVVALAQLNRQVENRSGGAPRLSDLRESGSIEQDADTVILMHKRDEEPGVIEFNVAKQRNGPTGQVKLAWLSWCMRFENYAQESPFHERNGHAPAP